MVFWDLRIIRKIFLSVYSRGPRGNHVLRYRNNLEKCAWWAYIQRAVNNPHAILQVVKSWWTGHGCRCDSGVWLGNWWFTPSCSHVWDRASVSIINHPGTNSDWHMEHLQKILPGESESLVGTSGKGQRGWNLRIFTWVTETLINLAPRPDISLCSWLRN